jgi:hypothetical protein
MGIKETLLSCKTYAEAKPILETAGISLSGHELARTAFSIQDKQPTVTQHFLQTIIQEMEGEAHGSSSTTGLEQVGSEEAVGDVKEQQNTHDQMGVPIGEMMPMGGQQYPPQQMGGFPPQQQQPCGQPQMQQPRPPMTQPQQQIQYMITEAIKAQVAPYVNQLRESIKTLDKKITETQKPQINSLDLSDTLGGMGKANHRFIQETVGNEMVDLETTRRNISKINDAMYSGIY